MTGGVITLAASIKSKAVHARLPQGLSDGVNRAYDCPRCNQVGFVVVQRPDIVRCLYCGSEWQFTIDPKAEPAVRNPPTIPMTKKATDNRYAEVLARYVARFHKVPPSILTEHAATELMLAALERGRPIAEQGGETG